MAAGVYNLLIQQGATFVKKLRWTDSAGTPKDLTGWKAKLHIRYNTEDVDPPIINLTTENGGLTLNSYGTVIIKISETVTKGITWDDAVYDLFVIQPSGQTDKLLQGTVQVALAVTRW